MRALVVLALVFMLAACVTEPEASLDGRWQGEVSTAAYSFPVVLELADDGGVVSGRALVQVWGSTTESTVSGSFQIPTASLSLDGAVFWTFTLTMDGDELRGATDGGSQVELRRLP